jgi:AraC family transcriptional regulator
MIYHPAGEAHADRFENHGGRIFHIEAGERFWSLADEHSLRLDVPADFRGGPPPSLALRMHREFQEMDSVSPLVMEGLALEIMGEVARSTTCGIVRRPPQWLSRAVDLIQDRFAETLHLEVIAAEVGVHPSHLARGFRAHHDCTVGEYVRRIRIQRASGLLANTEIPLVEIALQLGFADQAHFSRTFRRVTGRNPGEYRRTFRNC